MNKGVRLPPRQVVTVKTHSRSGLTECTRVFGHVESFHRVTFLGIYKFDFPHEIHSTVRSTLELFRCNSDRTPRIRQNILCVRRHTAKYEDGSSQFIWCEAYNGPSGKSRISVWGGESKMVRSERERNCGGRDMPTSEQSLPYAFELVDMTAKP